MEADERPFEELPSPYYATAYGEAHLGDSLLLLKLMPTNSVNLIVTSPPFALRKQKQYGNKEASEYVKWFRPFARQAWRVLKPTGSLVLHIGGSWERGQPTRSLYHFELLLDLCRRTRKTWGFFLAQDFYWFNPARLPSPAEWVTVKRVRVKDAVDPIWWFSKTENPKADNRKVLWPYTEAMARLIARGTYNQGPRPSGWHISNKFGVNHGGAIPPNLLMHFENPPNLLPIANTESNSAYLRGCREKEVVPHPARFPVDLPKFFIRFLTDEGDLVLDIFGGSNATGEAAEALKRRWVTFEKDETYLEGSRFRFPALQPELL